MKLTQIVAMAGLVSLFSPDTAYAKPKPLVDELFELAELSMKCGEKVSLRHMFYPGDQNAYPVYSPVDIYGLDVGQVSFRFRDGALHNSPDGIVDGGMVFEIIGSEIGFFRYDHSSKCGNFFPKDLEARVRQVIEYIKQNTSLTCNAYDMPLS